MSPDSNQLRVANPIAWFKGAELEQRQAYNTCMEQENKKQHPNKYNCQFRLNAADDYARKAAALEQSQPAAARYDPIVASL